MSDKYAVHRNYDVDWITLENPCRCYPPASGIDLPGNSMSKYWPITFQVWQYSALAPSQQFINLKFWNLTTPPWMGQSFQQTTLSGITSECRNAKRMLQWNIFAHINDIFFSFGGDMTDHCKYSPDIFFLSLFLFFGTFFLAFFLKKFKFTSFFPARVSVDNAGSYWKSLVCRSELSSPITPSSWQSSCSLLLIITTGWRPQNSSCPLYSRYV